MTKQREVVIEHESELKTDIIKGRKCYILEPDTSYTINIPLSLPVTLPKGV